VVGSGLIGFLLLGAAICSRRADFSFGLGFGFCLGSGFGVRHAQPILKMIPKSGYRFSVKIMRKKQA
jgi:hypothetical protein